MHGSSFLLLFFIFVALAIVLIVSGVVLLKAHEVGFKQIVLSAHVFDVSKVPL